MRGETSRPYGPLHGQTIRAPGEPAPLAPGNSTAELVAALGAVAPISRGGAGLSRRLSVFKIYLFNLIYLVEEKTFSRAV